MLRIDACARVCDGRSGVAVGDGVVVVWNGSKVEVNEVGEQIKFAGAFSCRARDAAVQAQTIFVAVDCRIDACNLQGTVKKAFSFSESEGACARAHPHPHPPDGYAGNPIVVDVAGDYLAAASDRGTLKMWEVGRREPRAVVPGRQLPGSVGSVTRCRVNRTGTHIAILSASTADPAVGPRPDSRLVVYDVDLDRFDEYDFAVKGALPSSLLWDDYDPRLLVVVVHPDAPASGGEREGATGGALVYTLFVTTEHGIRFQDRFPIGDDVLIGSETPFTYYIQGQTNAYRRASPPRRLLGSD